MSPLAKEVDLKHNVKLVQACERIAANWLPVNQELLTQIQKGLKEGAYDLSPEFLIEEITSDIGLFTYCLREISRIKNLDNESRLDPVKILEETDVATYKKILLVAPEEISTLSLKEAQPHQIGKLKEVLVGASASETLAESELLDSSFAFAAHILRHLGLTLIAWHYPEEFKKVCEEASDEQEIEVLLAQELGFSPSLLGLAIAKNWKLDPAILLAMGDREAVKKLSPDEREDALKTSGRLEKIAEVSDLLGKAAAPELYTVSEEDLVLAKEYINDKLGESGLRRIFEQTKKRSQAYQKIAPNVFQYDVLLKSAPKEKEPKTHSVTLDALLKENRFAKYCPQKMVEGLRKVYGMLKARLENKLVLRYLMYSVFPHTGFKRGCVFLLNPELMLLQPKIALGSTPLKDYSPYKAYPSAGGTNPVREAFVCNVPVVRSFAGLFEDSEGSIASIIGLKQRIGVLYVEPSEFLGEGQDHNNLMIFKAFLQTFCDILNIH
ncbi:MAG: HDOD domain-containing protein [Candidatus Dadabacteria bacterium]|nr:MAG: HDOD domain-containing protein [Candidatus Dadabacteria bacterium]